MKTTPNIERNIRMPDQQTAKSSSFQPESNKMTQTPGKFTMDIDSLNGAQILMDSLQVNKASIDFNANSKFIVNGRDLATTFSIIDKSKQVIPKLLSDLRVLKLENEQLLNENDEKMIDLQVKSAQDKLNDVIRKSEIGLNVHSNMQMEIEELFQENTELRRELEYEREQNQSKSYSSTDGTKEDSEETSRSLENIEIYRSKVLKLEAIIKRLREEGIQIPEMQKDEDGDSDLMVADIPMEVSRNEENSGQFFHELLRDIEELKTEKEEAMDTIEDMHIRMKQMKERLKKLGNEKESMSLVEEENMEFMMKQQRKDKEEKRTPSSSSNGVSPYLQMIMFVAFCVGVCRQKPRRLEFKKTYL